MENKTRDLLREFLSSTAKSNSVESVMQSYAVSPPEAERLTMRLRESTEMLGLINILPALDLEGVAGSLTAGGSLAKRSAPNQQRLPRNVSTEGVPFECQRTEYDASVPYHLLDSWGTARFPDFQQKLERALLEQQALDMLTVGFNGTNAAAVTDPVANPLLQDVNIGWLQKLRVSAPERVKAGVTIGGDYSTLDELVYDAIQLLEPCHRKRPGNVVMIDRDLLHTKLLANAKSAEESSLAQLVLTRILASNQIAGLPIFDAPGFPAGKVLVTSLSNLSIYVQGQRRFIKDQPHLNRLYSYSAQSEAYVVEDYTRCGLIEGIEFLESAG